MSTYELTTVYPGKLTPAKKKEAIKDVESLMKVNKGAILSTKEWGEIELTFPIRKNMVGTFLHFELELDPASLKDIEEKLRMDNSIGRHLIVRTN